MSFTGQTSSSSSTISIASATGLRQSRGDSALIGQSTRDTPTLHWMRSKITLPNHLSFIIKVDQKQFKSHKQISNNKK